MGCCFMYRRDNENNLGSPLEDNDLFLKSLLDSKTHHTSFYNSDCTILESYSGSKCFKFFCDSLQVRSRNKVFILQSNPRGMRAYVRD